jgi:hypothetical protein
MKKKESNSHAKKVKSVHPLQKEHDAKMNLPTDHQSQYNMNLNLNSRSQFLDRAPDNSSSYWESSRQYRSGQKEAVPDDGECTVCHLDVGWGQNCKQ